MMKIKMCVLFVILALVSQHSTGVEVYEGEESVLLPCQFAAPIPEGHAVVWRREDLSSPIIHSVVEGKDDVINQNKHYTNRTSMRADALQTGDLSLTLRNPTFTDSGAYTCLTRSRGEDKNRTEVQLKVTEPPLWPIVLTAVLVPVIILGAVFSAFILVLLYCVKERQKLMTEGQLTTAQATEGEESVLLPYKPSLPLPQGFRVEWIFVTDENKKVCVFKNGRLNHNQQHEDYRTRAEMKSYPPKKEKADQLNQPEVDLSLTLKNPVCADGGVYLCIIHDKHGKPVKLKVVTLLVKEHLVTTIISSVQKKNRTTSKRHPTVVLTEQHAEETNSLNGQSVGCVEAGDDGEEDEEEAVCQLALLHGSKTQSSV